MTISDKLSWVGGMLGLFTGFSVISGVEILYWLFFIILCKKRNEIEPEKTDELCEGCKMKESVAMKLLEEKFIKQEEKFLNQEEKIMKILRQEEETEKQKQQIGDLEKKVELIQMIQKQSEFGDSHAGTFFDAIFKTSVEKQENDIQNETV